MRPMWWVSGIQERLTSCSPNPATSVEPRQLARLLPCVSPTTSGSLVEADGDWLMEALQVIEDAERALVELGEGHLARLVLALEVGDAVRTGAVRLDQLGERGGVVHQRRRSSLMCSGKRVRRLICASSSSGLSGTHFRR